MANNGFDKVRANEAIAQGRADLVAFGKPFISNPDLVGWKLFRQRHDAPRPSDRNVVRRLRHAVGHRRSECHIVGVGVDEVGEQFSHRLARRKEIRRSNGPRLSLAPQAAITGDQRSFRQRRYVGAVEKRDLVRDVEKMTLARKREPRVRVQIGHRDPPSFSRVMTRPERSGKASNEQSFFLHSPDSRGALSKQLNYLISLTLELEPVGVSPWPARHCPPSQPRPPRRRRASPKMPGTLAIPPASPSAIPSTVSGATAPSSLTAAKRSRRSSRANGTASSIIG